VIDYDYRTALRRQLGSHAEPGEKFGSGHVQAHRCGRRHVACSQGHPADVNSEGNTQSGGWSHYSRRKMTSLVVSKSNVPDTESRAWNRPVKTQVIGTELSESVRVTLGST
jgi:hypothetical protein